MNLKQFREDNNIKQGEIADLLKCSQVFISNVEKGIKTLSPDKIEILKNAYGDKFNRYITSNRKVILSNQDLSQQNAYALIDKMLTMLDEKDMQLAILSELVKKIDLLSVAVAEIKTNIE